jgi:hypothetical protein
MIPVSRLEIDRRVQRHGLNKTKVTRMVKNWNPDAVGVIHVSRRKDRSEIILDGQHRHEACRIKTDNQGEMECHVYEGLTLAEEAQMFLDLNDTTQPPIIDKFKVLLHTDSEEGDDARNVSELLGAYGWTISNVAAPGHVNCVKIVQRMYELSKKIGAEPNLIQATILTISRAWGNDRLGVQGPVFEGIARMYARDGSKIDHDHLIDVLKLYRGGPMSLISEAQQLAAIRKGKVAMAVAEVLVEAYNKGRRTKTLDVWQARS